MKYSACVLVSPLVYLRFGILQLQVSVLVLYFAKSADLTGLKSEVIHVQPELTTLALWQELVNRHSR